MSFSIQYELEMVLTVHPKPDSPALMIPSFKCEWLLVLESRWGRMGSVMHTDVEQWHGVTSEKLRYRAWCFPAGLPWNLTSYLLRLSCCGLQGTLKLKTVPSPCCGAPRTQPGQAVVHGELRGQGVHCAPQWRPDVTNSILAHPTGPEQLGLQPRAPLWHQVISTTVSLSTFPSWCGHALFWVVGILY